MATVTMGGAPVSGSPESGGASAATRRPWWRAWRLPASVVGGTGLIGLHASLYGNWIIDDAAITFAYARSFADGLGPVVQPGSEPVEGYSNPAWAALLALGKLLGLFDRGTIFGIPDYVLFPKALALLFCAGILTACYAAAARVTTRPWLATLITGGMLASIPSFVIWVSSGLENAMYACTVTVLAVLVFRAVLDDRVLRTKLAVGTGLLAALAALTRPEGLIYAGGYPLVVLGTLRRSAARPSIRALLLSVAAFIVPVGAYFLWRYSTFGLWMSSPSIAKKQDIPFLWEFTKSGELVEYAGAPAVLLVVVCLGVALARPAWWRRGLLALLVPLGLALVAYTILERDWMAQYRFATPIWVLGALTATLTVGEVLRRAVTRSRVLISVALVAVLPPTLGSFAVASADYQETPDISACYVADRFGRAFNGYADVLGLEEGSLVLPDLGGSAMTSRLELIDMAGLTDQRFAELVRDDDHAGQAHYVFEELRPTFIHTRQPWTDGNRLGYDPRLERDYHRIHPDVYQPPPNGDWVRKDVVPDEAALADLRAYAVEHTAPVEHNIAEWPTRACGDTLSVGQTETGRT